MEAQYLLKVDPAMPSFSDPVVFGPLEVVDAQAVTFNPNVGEIPSGSPVNALIETDRQPHKPVGSVTHWRFEFSNGTAASGGVGFTTPEKFGPGWSIRAIYQAACGNFAGRGALRTSWAKPHGNPSFVDWYMERTSDCAVTLYTVVNGEVQPTPAIITFGSGDIIDKLRPVVLFDAPPSGPATTKCTVRIYRQVPIDTNPMVSYRKTSANTSAIDSWLFDDPEYAGAVLNVLEDGQIVIRVANIIHPPVTLLSVDQRSGPVKIEQRGIGVNTRMMPPGDLARVERLICESWIKNLGQSWKLEGDNRLIIGTASFSRTGPPPPFQVAAEDQGLC